MKNKIWMLAALLMLAMGQVSAAEKITYYHLDALGSPIAATDQNGNLAWKEAYKPYGERIRKEDGGSNSTWYTGKQEDEDNGLTYFGARWYDPAVGRFMGIDPVGVKEENIHSFNRFAYANNNPYKFVDPDGMESQEAAWASLGLPNPNAKLTQTAGNIAQGANSGANIADNIAHSTATDPLTWIPGLGLAGATLKIKGLAKEIGILRDAAKGRGMFGLGAASRAEADKLGRAWVGNDYTISSDGKTLVSMDKLRQYRPPSYKPKLGKTQANFEQKYSGQKSKKWQSNGHLDITD